MVEKKTKTDFKNFQVFKRDEYDKSMVGTIFASIFLSAIGGGIVGFLAATYYVWVPMLIGGFFGRGRNPICDFFGKLAINDHSFGLRFVIGAIAGFIISVIGMVCLYRKYMSE